MEIIDLAILVVGFYAIGFVLLFVRILGLIITGKDLNMRDISNIVLFPLLLLTNNGRLLLKATLKETNGDDE